MTCLGCGRTLKSEKSIQIEYGPVCYRRMFPGKKKTTMDGNRRDYSLADDKNYSVPGQYSLSDYIDM